MQEYKIYKNFWNLQKVLAQPKELFQGNLKVQIEDIEMDDDLFKESEFEIHPHKINQGNHNSDPSLAQIGEKADQHMDASRQRAIASRGTTNKAPIQSHGQGRGGRMSSVSEAESGAIADDDFMEPNTQNRSNGTEHKEEGQIDEGNHTSSMNDFTVIKRATQSQPDPSNLMRILAQVEMFFNRFQRDQMMLGASK